MKICIKKCNNITEGNITVERNKLNIKYGMNGTGKSTIARALECKGNDIRELKTFGSDDNPEVETEEELNNVLIFNNEFINSVIFKGSEVIDDAFEIFIKSEKYDEQREIINNILNKLNGEIFKDTNVSTLRTVLLNISSKIVFNSNQKSLKKTPTYKTILESENLLEVPKELNKYTEFLVDKENSIDWVDWKTKGFVYDDKKKCPFCAEGLKPEYTKEKEKFTQVYTKANVKNLSEFNNWIEELAPYLLKEKFEILRECIKSGKTDEEIELIFIKFLTEINYLLQMLNKLEEFDSYRIKNSEISKLEEKVLSLKIQLDNIDFLKSELMLEIVNNINSKINEILEKVVILKTEVGKINGYIESAIKTSKNEINSFLATAGFNYEFEFEVTDEKNSKTILKYKDKNDNNINVDDINKHLSWGEKNAFALVLFMYYALNRKSDLIILDDPISSFDSNKKYAIINKLFENRTDKKSFYGRTVLMLTHDFEPIIDFVINNKPNSGHALAKYIKNRNGMVEEENIETNTDIQSIIKICYMYAKSDINVISKMNFLRRYIEHINIDNDMELNLAYDILSSLIHNKENPDKKINREECVILNDKEIEVGKNYIRNYIADFDYHQIRNSTMKPENLISLYEAEKNSYIRSQIFREYLIVTDKKDKITDDNLLKFIDEIYHIENDYIFSLDLIKFDTIPDFIINKINSFMENEK